MILRPYLSSTTFQSRIRSGGLGKMTVRLSGIAPEGGLVAGISLARSPEPNDFGVAGQRWAAFNGPEFKGIGCGQHGGWGPDETRPFLIVDHPRGKPGRRTERTSLIDIAPTILSFLGLPADGMEGKAIAWG